MKKTFVFFKSILMIVLMCVPFAFVSCEKEETVYLSSIYETEFEHDWYPSQTSLAGYNREKGYIVNAFKEEFASLGISDMSRFIIKGKTADCDKKIKDACKRAEEKLKTKTFYGSWVWHVKRVGLGEPADIYTFSINYDSEESDMDEKDIASVAFAYQNYETDDILEYCNVVIEYTDGSGTKVENVTNPVWTKKFDITPLPSTYSFKKTYTLKADKDMASAKQILFARTSHAYSYQYFNGYGNPIGKSILWDETQNAEYSAGETVANYISNGSFNNSITFTLKGKSVQINREINKLK